MVHKDKLKKVDLMTIDEDKMKSNFATKSDLLVAEQMYSL